MKKLKRIKFNEDDQNWTKQYGCYKDKGGIEWVFNYDIHDEEYIMRNDDVDEVRKVARCKVDNSGFVLWVDIEDTVYNYSDIEWELEPMVKGKQQRGDTECS